MVGFESAHHSRLITGLRTGAELLDNCTDGISTGQLVTTVILLLIVALHATAELLETCPDVLSIPRTRFGRK